MCRADGIESDTNLLDILDGNERTIASVQGSGYETNRIVAEAICDIPEALGAKMDK
jgi:hypothetical protein